MPYNGYPDLAVPPSNHCVIITTVSSHLQSSSGTDGMGLAKELADVKEGIRAVSPVRFGRHEQVLLREASHNYPVGSCVCK